MLNVSWTIDFFQFSDNLRLNFDDINHDQRRDREIAKLLITVVLVFIACHSFRMVLNTYEVFHLAYYGDIQDQWPAW